MLDNIYYEFINIPKMLQTDEYIFVFLPENILRFKDQFDILFVSKTINSSHIHRTAWYKKIIYCNINDVDQIIEQHKDIKERSYENIDLNKTYIYSSYIAIVTVDKKIISKYKLCI